MVSLSCMAADFHGKKKWFLIKRRGCAGQSVPANVWRHAVGGGSVKVGKNREK
jgi:hypothetical protein